jgi:hypothetical protein
MLETFAPDTPAIVTAADGREYIQIDRTVQTKLIEPNGFDDAAWNTSFSDITLNAITAPDGTLTATKLIEDETGNGHSLNQFFTVTNTTQYCFGFHAKADERAEIRLDMSDTSGFPANCNCYFDLAAGAVGTAGGGLDDQGIKSIGDGWYYCWIVATADASASSSFGLLLSDGTEDTTYQGDGTSGVHVWGSQLEEGAYPTSYIRYSAEVTTRVATETYWASADVPAAFRRRFKIKWIPSEDDTIDRFRYFLDFEDSGSSPRIAVYYFWSTKKFRIYDQTGATELVTSIASTLDRNQEIMLDVDPIAGTLEVQGAITGNGLYTGTPWLTTEGNVYVGQTKNQTAQCGGLLSEPYDPVTGLPVANFSDITFTNGIEQYIHFDERVINFAVGELPVIGYDGRLFVQSEPQTINAITEAQRFEESTWTNPRITVTPRNIPAPDGSLTAAKCVPTTDNNTHPFSQSVSFTSGNSYTLAVFAKSFGYDLKLELPNAQFTGAPYAFFNLATGAVGTTNDLDGSGIEPAGDDYYLCWITATADATASGAPIIYITDGETQSYVGDTTSGVYLWNAQTEIGDFPSSPINSHALINTRQADSFYWAAGSYDRALLNSKFAFKYFPKQDHAANIGGFLLYFYDSGSGKVISLEKSASGAFRIRKNDGGWTTLVTVSSMTWSVDQETTVLVDPAEGSLEFQDTTTGGTKVTGTAWDTFLPTTSVLYLGSDNSGANIADALLSKPYKAT